MGDTKRQSLPKTFGKVEKMRRYWIPATVLGVGILVFVGGYYFGNTTAKQPKPTPTKQIQEAPVKKAPLTISCAERFYEVSAKDAERGLWGIAERHYGGRGYLNALIAERNSWEYPSLKENPNFIQIGWVLIIPCSICDLPSLDSVKPTPVKKAVKKVAKKVVAVVPQVSPCPACPKVEILPTPPAPVVAPPQKASLPEAPKPPPAPAPVEATPAPQPVVQQPVPPAVVVAPAPVVAPPVPQPIAPPVKPAPPDLELVPPEDQSNYEAPVIRTTPPKAPIPPPTLEHRGREEGSQAKEKPKSISTNRLAPGSLWNIVGTSPLERGNWIDYFHIDQGILLGRIGKVQIVPYIGLNAVKDTKHYSWNNRVQGEAGIKGVWFSKRGVVEVGTAYAAERRFGKDLAVRTKTGLIGFAQGWEGWQLPTIAPPAKRFLPGTLPGSFQWRVGNISPFERNNVIGSLRVDQGFTLAQVGRVSFIPTASIQAWADSDRNPWNRRYMYGGGMRMAIPFKSGTVDLNAGYMCAKQYSGAPIARSNGCGPALSVSFWKGWSRQ